MAIAPSIRPRTFFARVLFENRRRNRAPSGQYFEPTMDVTGLEIIPVSSICRFSVGNVWAAVPARLPIRNEGDFAKNLSTGLSDCRLEAREDGLEMSE